VIHYQRVMPKRSGPEQAERLKRAAATAPGVVAVARVEPHPEGGFSVVVDSEDTLGEHFLAPFLKHLEAAGFSPIV
jgi:hypothetical protein